MAHSIICTVDPAGNLMAMQPAQPRSEDFMQALVAAHPELVADQAGALLLIRCEQPIADQEDGGGRWSLDHLFMTRSGIAVPVELRRAVDTRLRREVIDANFVAGRITTRRPYILSWASSASQPHATGSRANRS